MHQNIRDFVLTPLGMGWVGWGRGGVLIRILILVNYLVQMTLSFLCLTLKNSVASFIVRKSLYFIFLHW